MADLSIRGQPILRIVFLFYGGAHDRSQSDNDGYSLQDIKSALLKI